ncbi:MAG: sortase A [Cellvibrionaceae bacterium]|jgi:sortase A
MARKKSKDLDNLSERELEEALYRKRYAERKNRLTRLKDEGRVVDGPINQTLDRSRRPLTYVLDQESDEQMGYIGSTGPNDETDETIEQPGRRGRWGWLFNRSLLLIEIAAAIGFIWIVFSLVGSLRQLNSDIAEVQQAAVSSADGVATPTLPPVIDLVLLPTGHKPPVEGQPIVYEEAAGIPEHLLPLVDAYIPPIAPTPAPEQPRQIAIAKIGVNAPIFQGHEEEQLKKGVGHSIGTALVGSPGNMVLSAHNDIYGEIFRNLDQLETGDEVVVSSGRESYTYIVNNIQVVEPTAVEVMAPTNHSSLTLISCYPYLIDNKRIIIKADLKETLDNESQS